MFTSDTGDPKVEDAALKKHFGIPTTFTSEVRFVLKGRMISKLVQIYTITVACQAV